MFNNNNDGAQRPRFNAGPAREGGRKRFTRPDSTHAGAERVSSYGKSYHNDGEAPRPRFNQERPNGFRPRFNDGEQRPNSFRPRFNDGEQRPNGFRPRFNDGERSEGFNRERRPRFNNEERPAGYGSNGGFHSRPKRNDGVYSQRKRQQYQEKYEDPTKPIRLNKYLANAGICSRREADDFILAGVITVNGEVVDSLGAKVLPTDRVMFHDQPVRREKKVYILLNKPKNTVTTTDDPQERHTVLDIVRNACSERIYPVGRLDRNTTGVLLLTNDGDLAAKLTHPKFGKKKIYAVTLDRDLDELDEQTIRDGVILDDERIVPDALEFPKEDRKHIGLEIHSGQNRVVRRTFEKVGYKVMQLDRVSFAGLTKKNVARGKYRFLTPKEVSMLQMGAFE